MMAKTVMPVALLALMPFWTACTDSWDDHYEGTAEGMVSKTMWQTINEDQNLSNFAKVLKATGYDETLNSTQVFTVFAPVNSLFTETRADSVIDLFNAEQAAGMKLRDNRAIKEFVENHIALYNYSVTETSVDTVVMLNGKYMELKSGAFSTATLQTTNTLTQNGILFTLEDKANYAHNVFEYLQNDPELDSVGKFLKQYTYYEFMPSQSVAWGVEDGKTVYLDSVFALYNTMFSQLGLIQREDSFYRMVAPTNEVWKQLVEEYEHYFNYDKQVRKRDSMLYVAPRLAILKGTAFSRTRNAKQVNGEFEWNRDSAMSVAAPYYSYRRSYFGSQLLAYYQYAKPFDEGGVFTGGTTVNCSNGEIIKASTWNIDKRSTFMWDLFMEGENRNYLESVDETTTNDPSSMSIPSTINLTDTATLTTVTISNPFYQKVSSNTYTLISPKGVSNASVTFKIFNQLSNVPYDIYVVFVPAIAADPLSTDNVPVKFRASYSCHNEEGNFPGNNGKVTYTVLSVDGASEFETDPTKVDTVKVASGLTFPVSSWDLDESQVYLKLETRLRSADRNNHTHTANMRIDCIIVKPHEE